MDTHISQVEDPGTRSRPLEADLSQGYVQKIFEDFPALIWRAGLDMKCDYFNRTWLEFTGRSLEQEQGDGWAEGVHPDELEACFRTYVGCFQARQPFSMFYRLKNRFGEYRWIKDMGRPFYGLDEEFLGYIGSCYDVTEERETAQKLEALNRSKDKFFTIIAHDLKGPMGAIEGLTEILDTSFGDFDRETLAEMVHELSGAASRTSRLLSDLLAWAHSQLQGTVCQPGDLSLAPLIREAGAPLLESFRLKHIDLGVTCPENLRVWADADMLKTVVRNLLSNALKFSPEGTSVSVTADVLEGKVVLKVRDQGIGIPPENLEDLFSLGKRPSTPGTKGEQGTGLGLAICRDFAERNGGKIWAESQVGRGTTFLVLVPGVRPAQ